MELVTLPQTEVGRCRRCGVEGQVVAHFRQQQGYCQRCAFSEEVRDAAREIEKTANKIIASAVRVMMSAESGNSPACKMGDSRALRMLAVVVEFYSAMSARFVADYDQEGIENWMLRTASRLQSIDAERWDGYGGLPGLLHPAPWTDCQISFSDSHDDRVYHMGTGFNKYLGSGSGSRSCGGPLRTEEELRVGMCGSCLMRFGKTIGTAVTELLNQEVPV